MADQTVSSSAAEEQTPFARLLDAMNNYMSASWNAGVAQDENKPAEETDARLHEATAALESALNAYVDARVEAVLNIPPGHSIVIAEVDPQP